MQAQVINNCQGPHYIQCPKKGNNPGEILVLRPGLNLVDSKKLADLRKWNALFDKLFSAKIPPSRAQEADPRTFGKPMLEVKGAELPDQAPLAKLKLDDASAIVAETQNTDLLKTWLEECSPTEQPALIKAINRRIKEIASGIDQPANDD